MTLEDWNTFLQVASVVILGLTFLIGTGALWTSYLVGKRQEERLASIAKDTAAANERASTLELKLEQQRERAANAELDLLEVQQRLAPRTITADQERIIVARLSKFRDQRLIVFTVTGNEETFQLGRRLQLVFEAAGLTVQSAEGSAFARAHSGISLAAGKNRTELAEAIKEALLATKVTDSVPIEPDANADFLTVMVWAKRA